MATIRRPGRKLLAFDRRFGVRFVAGADEAGRGSLAGPLVTAGVLLDYERLRDHAVRPLALLNDSKQVDPCAARGALPRGRALRHPDRRARDPARRDRPRRPPPLEPARPARGARPRSSPPAEVCLVDGFRLGPLAPEHQAVVDGDTKSAAIAAASIVAKVVRDRAMRRLDALYPSYDFASHVGYITPGHSAIVRRLGPSAIHRRSFDARCYAELEDDAVEAELVTAARA